MFDPAAYVLRFLEYLVLMVLFGVPLFGWYGSHRTAIADALSDWPLRGVLLLGAAVGLVLTGTDVVVKIASILGIRHRPTAIPALVASYIFAAYWFTASTSFANPAVTLARSLTQTFAGIRPEDVGWFIVAQILGAVAGYVVASLVIGPDSARA